MQSQIQATEAREIFPNKIPFTPFACIAREKNKWDKSTLDKSPPRLKWLKLEEKFVLAILWLSVRCHPEGNDLPISFFYVVRLLLKIDVILWTLILLVVMTVVIISDSEEVKQPTPPEHSTPSHWAKQGQM